MDLQMISWTSDDGWQVRNLIEGYQSLIWTERFGAASNFELKTPLISETMIELPLTSCVTLRDSYEVLIVETHQIDRDENGNDILTVTGRGFETILEQRAVVNQASDYNNNTWTGTPWGLATLLIGNSLIPGNVIVAADAVNDVQQGQSWGGPEQDYIQLQMKAGQAYDAVLDYLARQDKHNMRTLKPGLTGRGKLTIDTYSPKNLTKDQSTYPYVLFSVKTGSLVNPSLLESFQNWKNVAYVVCKQGMEIVAVNDDWAGVPGTFRRVIQVDASDIDTISDPTKLSNVLKDRGQTAMVGHNVTKILGGALNPESPYIYNVHYGLGDKVSCWWEDYNIRQPMFVTEYTRTWDGNGETAYPTLSVSRSDSAK